MRLQIDNEYDPLEAVLVHRPGAEIERLTHESMRGFLFEDIPFLKRMQREHDDFTARMRDQGVQVYYLEAFLQDLVQVESTRAALLGSVCRTEGVPAIGEELASLKHWDVPALVEMMFAGLTYAEFRQRTGQSVERSADDEQFLLPPIPNAYFSRDPAVVVHGAAISCKMHYPQRVRETLLIRAVLENHPEFAGNAITYGGTSEPTEDRPYTIEGGDVIILSPQAVLIGASERTRSETIERLAAKCFRVGQVLRVYEVPIPTERAFMHLDTVFTVIDRGVVLWFAPVMAHLKYIHRYEPGGAAPGVQRVPEDRTLPDILRDEFACDLTIIETAGGSRHFGSREQRTDGTNAFAIAPRVAVVYERNERTAAALEQAGVRCVIIEGSELVRGLGGPRCMTMPLRRRAT